MSPFTFGEDPFEENEFVTVVCSVIKGDLPITIGWLFNNKTVSASDEISISQTGKRTSNLAIDSVKGHHAGTYSCIGRNDAGYDIHSSELIVNGLSDVKFGNPVWVAFAALVVALRFGEDPLEANEFVTVTCSVLKGDFPLNISWAFNNESLSSSDEVTITKTGKRMSVLVIESVKGHHAGTYSCIGLNDAGSDVHSADLLVN
ncbi:unnamed protein product, partial [Nesidiocoris tenuis]